MNIIDLESYKDNEYITVMQACELSKIKKTTLLKMIKDKRLNGVKVRKLTNKFLINKSDFIKFIEDRTVVV